MSRSGEVAIGTLILVAFVTFWVVFAIRSPFLSRNVRADVDSLEVRVKKLEGKKSK